MLRWSIGHGQDAPAAQSKDIAIPQNLTDST